MVISSLAFSLVWVSRDREDQHFLCDQGQLYYKQTLWKCLSVLVLFNSKTAASEIIFCTPVVLAIAVATDTAMVSDVVDKWRVLHKTPLPSYYIAFN